MSDYISRKEAIDAFQKATSDGDNVYFCWYVLRGIPSADVVEVVRCKDCGFWNKKTIRQNSNDVSWWNEALCERHSRYGNEHYEAWTDADWYCADGERADR